MTTRLDPFSPAGILPKVTDPVTGESFPPRPSLTVEQEREATDYALAEMSKRRVWTVEVEVRWTRQDTTILTVRGHAERMGEQRIPVLDGVEERTLDGAPVRRSPADRYEQMVAELEAIEGEEGL